MRIKIADKIVESIADGTLLVDTKRQECPKCHNSGFRPSFKRIDGRKVVCVRKCRHKRLQAESPADV